MYRVIQIKPHSLNNYLLGPDHVQLTFLNWDTERVFALIKKLKVYWKFQFFI